MNSIAKILLMVLLSIMLSGQVSAQTSPNKLEIGFNVSRYQKDIGLGLHLISPYFIKEKIAIKAGANLLWFEYFNGSETTFSLYQNFQLGIKVRNAIFSDKLFMYGEGGFLTILPNSAFSSESSVFGGYGLFGIEFRPSQKAAYFVELGGVGSGAIADKIAGEPKYSNGFLINVGYRIGL
ncbi:hypothetical protein [Marivirga sp.]|uniref:hypothetical protein n=1 Tax=Marivirga sp. TaxID=2018662 RepID=UPI002D7FF767|nr:hypothetical protein [Marivirga sp.]HET8858906.1 hypothetical protein [Marivirga sp.]